MTLLFGVLELKRSDMYKRLDQCLCCSNTDLFTVLDLNTQPPANSFHKPEEQLPDYELKLMGCSRCWHTQLSVAVDPSELFKHYLYVSGTSKTLKEYFDWFAGVYHLPDFRKPRVLDIACNDGTQLDSFKDLGWDTWGVDPAENLHPVSTGKGHKVKCAFWNQESAKGMPKFDLITAQNVFAHTAEVSEFLKACKKVMRPDTILVIQTSQAMMFDRNEFDTIYHEHISFFSTSSMQAIARKHKLFLHRAYTTDIHGTSYVFELRKRPSDSSIVRQQLAEEQYRYNRKFYAEYQTKAMECLTNLKDYIDLKRSAGVKVIGYGAAAKGMTVINAGKIKLDYIVDDNPLKQGLLCPGSNIPVHGSDVLADERDNVVIVPLAWNFFDEIKAKARSLRPGYLDTFVKYFPVLKMETD